MVIGLALITRRACASFVASALTLLISAQTATCDDDVFLRQTVDRTSVFVGEQVVNTFELYTRVPLVNPQFIDLAFDGFWQESFSQDQHGSAQVKGRFYDVIKIRRALFALTSGTKSLPQRQIKASTIEMRQLPPLDDFDPFDRQFMQRFFGEEEYRERIFRSNTLSLEVKPLPEPSSSLPVWPGSRGLVGSTSVRINSNASDVRTGESKTITIDVASIGNLSKLQAPSFAPNPNYRIYAERPRSQIQETNGRLVSRRIFKISVVPLVAGEIQLEPLRLAYFDPETQEYHVVEATILPFKALPNPSADALAAPITVSTAAPTAQAVSATPPLQATIPVSSRSDEPAQPRVSSAAAMFAVFLVALCLVIAFFLRGRSQRLDKEVLRTISSADNLHDLFEAFRAALVSQLSITPVPQSSDALRFAITKIELEAQTKHSLLSALDGLVILSDQSADPNEPDFARLKDEIQLALSALRRKRA